MWTGIHWFMIRALKRVRKWYCAIQLMRLWEMVKYSITIPVDTFFCICLLTLFIFSHTNRHPCTSSIHWYFYSVPTIWYAPLIIIYSLQSNRFELVLFYNSLLYAMCACRSLSLVTFHSFSFAYVLASHFHFDGWSLDWLGLAWLWFGQAFNTWRDVWVAFGSLVVFVVVVGRHCRCSLTDSCYIFTLCRFHLNSFCSQSLNALRLCCKNCSLSSHTYVRCIMALIQCTEWRLRIYERQFLYQFIFFLLFFIFFFVYRSMYCYFYGAYCHCWLVGWLSVYLFFCFLQAAKCRNGWISQIESFSISLLTVYQQLIYRLKCYHQ